MFYYVFHEQVMNQVFCFLLFMFSKYICSFLIFLDKDDLAEKQRMAVELGAQGATLNDQRSHIDVLDTALSNAQANVIKLQEEVT